jgi:hypothetical protein
VVDISKTPFWSRFLAITIYRGEVGSDHFSGIDNPIEFRRATGGAAARHGLRVYTLRFHVASPPYAMLDV